LADAKCVKNPRSIPEKCSEETAASQIASTVWPGAAGVKTSMVMPPSDTGGVPVARETPFGAQVNGLMVA
jgi:hypothetical protein